ncbi:radical SAM protein [bacterium F16]|nr:radical SAM protein [bacterium F16]
MKMLLIFPRWPKLDRQTEFHLPPNGAMCFAAEVPQEVDLEFVDDNLQAINFDGDYDLVGISTLLTCQLPRAFEIADTFRNKGTKVIFGGISTMLHSEEVSEHADSIFLGEVEGRFAAVIDDFKKGQLKPVYNYMAKHPEISLVGPARRELLNRDLYNYRGVQMVDLIHASRGCKFDCFPCCQGFLGGKAFRPRPVDQVIEEMAGIPNNRMFIVDNSLAQDKAWLLDLFREMKPLKKKWVSHPIKDDPEVLKAAAEAGAWYVYQAVFDTSNTIRERIKRLKDHGIGIEGTIILGTDDQDVDYIKRLVDFLLEVEMEVAEFTIMTPFAHSPVRHQLEQEKRIFNYDLKDYTCDKVVFQPKKMTVDELQEMYYYAWDTFYAEGGYAIRMGKLFQDVIKREIDDGTYRRYNPRIRKGFKKENV